MEFALARLRFPLSLIQFLLSLFHARTNQVITHHGLTPSYRVNIGIDQGEIISPLLWVIYIDPLLTALQLDRLDPYRVSASNLTSISPLTVQNYDVEFNNLVFMDDSTLISSSKAGMEHMLSITEEFYLLNNTSANHKKYVLLTNSVSRTTATLPPITFTLALSDLNRVPSISIVPLPMGSSFRFLGVWFNLSNSTRFVTSQLAAKFSRFAGILSRARLTAKQLVYLHNAVLIPKVEYRMQVTFLSERDCAWVSSKFRSLFKRKLGLAVTFPSCVLHSDKYFGLISLYTHQSACLIHSFFQFANSSVEGLHQLFLIHLINLKVRLCLTCSLLQVSDWSFWSSLSPFKIDLFARICHLLVSLRSSLYLSLSSSFPDLTVHSRSFPLSNILRPHIFALSMPAMHSRLLFFLSQVVSLDRVSLCSWPAFRPRLADKRSSYRIPHWYTALASLVTFSPTDSPSLDLRVEYYTTQSSFPVRPCISTPRRSRISLGLCNLTNVQSKQWLVSSLKSSSLTVYGRS